MRCRLAASLAFLFAACAAVPPPPPRPSPEALRASLTQAELDFAAATAARGVDGWVDAFAEEGRQISARGVAAQGEAGG